MTFFKNSSLEPCTGLISTKLGYRHSCVKRIQVGSNEGALLSSTGDFKEIAKIHQLTLKILFCRTTGPISTKLGQCIFV